MSFLRGVPWAVIVPIGVELCARAVARRSPFEWIVGSRPSLDTLVILTIAAAGLGVVASRRLSVQLTALVFAALFALGVAAQIHFGARLQSDGFYYFSYLRSLAFDRDVEFSNDYTLLGLGDKPHLFVPTPTGYAQSAWTIGPAIVWAPFFAAAHPVAAWLAAGGADVSTNGVSYPYRQAVCLAGLFYALLGSWFTFRLASLFFGARLAAGAVAFTIAGSFMLWYIVREPSMTHAPSMAGVAALAWFWAATHGRRTKVQWALLGLLAGFITLIRWQNGLFAILPAFEALSRLVGSARARDRAGVLSTLIGGGLFTACAVIGFLPQMLAWKSIYGSYLAVSPIGPQIRWWDPQLVDIIWSSRNGLVSWSPILSLGAIGLVLLASARPSIGVPAILAVIVMTYFNASTQDWWGSAGYGGRRFDGTVPLFALGVAAFADAAIGFARRHPVGMVSAAGGLLVLWNLALISAAHGGYVRIGEAMSFGEAGAHQARALHRWFGHPFTYPASLIFAARNDVPIGAYDLLAANRFLGDPLRPFGRIDVGEPYDGPFLEGGWHAAEREGTTSFRWTEQTATIIVVLDHAAPLRVQLRAQPFAYPGAPGQTARILVNGVERANTPLAPGWATSVVEIERAAWRAGVNRVTFVFAYAARPADVGLGGDDRSLAAAIDYLRVEISEQADTAR